MAMIRRQDRRDPEYPGGTSLDCAHPTGGVSGLNCTVPEAGWEESEAITHQVDHEWMDL
jgi:hypothetical protein